MATSDVHDTSPGGGAPVVHLDTEQRARIGRAARAAVPRSAHAEWVPGPDRADPTALLTAQETTPRSRPRSPTPRTDARVPLHLLPGGGDHHGRGPRGLAEHRAPGAGVRRRPPLELRRLRGTGPSHDVRRQRLRRDQPRTVRVGRQASGAELRDRGPLPILLDEGGPWNRRSGREVLPRGDDRLRQDDEPRRLVRTSRRREGLQRVPIESHPVGEKAVRAQPGQGAGEGQHEGVRQALRTRGR